MAESGAAAGKSTSSIDTYSYSAKSYDRTRTNEEELFEMVRLSEVPIDKELFKVILELLKLNVAPAAILQVLKSLRSHATPDDLRSHSPLSQASNDSASGPRQPLPPATSSETRVPSGATLSGGSSDRENVKTLQSEQPRQQAKESRPSRSTVSSSDKLKPSGEHHHHHHHHHHRHKSRSSSGSRRKPRDPTGGSAKLKIRETQESISS